MIVTLGVGIVTGEATITAIQPAKIELDNGEVLELPISLVNADREDLHKFIDQFYDAMIVAAQRE